MSEINEEYKITIMNDAYLFDGHGKVHTWLKFDAPGKPSAYFGFNHSRDGEVGYVETDENLSKRTPSQSTTFYVSEEQYSSALKEVDLFGTLGAIYRVEPNGINTYNCVTASDYILKKAGINFLSGASSPFTVAGRINGFSYDASAFISPNETARDLSYLFAGLSFDFSIDIGGEYYDIGLTENIPDAYKYIYNMIDATYNNLVNYIEGLSADISPGLDKLVKNISNSLTESMYVASNILDLIKSGDNNSPLLNNLVNYYQQSLQNYANGLAYILNGGTIPLSLVEQCLLPPGVTFPGMMLPGFIPPGTCGPDMSIPETTTSPVILDLDGDGIETRGLQDRIFFDHDGNHFAENTGWVSADDGLLVIDKDCNGKIDSGNELFGNNTVLSNGSLAANGYEALQELDTNGDGTLNSRDEAWQQLQVWQDRNGNARVDDGELMSLSEAGIAAIDTDYKNSTWVDKQGNAHKQTGEVIYLDGSEGQSADVWFDVDKGYTSYTLDIVVPQSVRALPWVRGFGNMTDLHVAMSLNPELQTMVEQYIVDPLNSQALLQDIIFTWAGVADIAADSRGENIDARRLSVLEKATGENYQNKVNGTTDPLKNAAVLLEDEYKRFSDFIEASLLSQTLYRDDFATISLTMKSDYSGLTLNFDDFASHLESIKLTDVNEYLHLRKTFYSLFEYSPSCSDVREQLGIPSEQLFFGDDGNDTLSGNKTNDYIWGSTGNDTLKGGYGSDTYFFSAGDGKDSLYEGSSNAGDVDTLRLGEGIRPEDVILQRKITNGLSANDRLVISFRDSTDSITIDNFFTAERYQVEAVIFADGTVWDVDTIKARLLEGNDDAQTITTYDEGHEIHAAAGNDAVTGGAGIDLLYGEAGDDTLKGGNNDDRLYGGEGNDTLDGGNGADTLTGSTGNDTLKGGYGSDTYFFSAGDGKDSLYEGSSNAGDVDTLRFGEGIRPEDVILQRKITNGLSANDRQIISFRDSTDSITIDNFFTAERYQVEAVIFADGTVWDVDTIKARLLEG
ncbi:calcium-binding protein, partial [Kluyvera ascorbata]